MQPQANPQLCSSHFPTHPFLPMLGADVDEEHYLLFYIKIPPYTTGAIPLGAGDDCDVAQHPGIQVGISRAGWGSL